MYELTILDICYDMRCWIYHKSERLAQTECPKVPFLPPPSPSVGHCAICDDDVTMSGISVAAVCGLQLWSIRTDICIG